MPLKDEDRLSYLLYRRDRDIVHGKPGSEAPATPKTPDKEKDKKPFEDKVLQKALEYLRDKVKAVGKVRAATEVGDA